MRTIFVFYSDVSDERMLCFVFNCYVSNRRTLYFVLYSEVSDERTLCFVFDCYLVISAHYICIL